MDTTNDSHCVAAFARHEDAKVAIRELERVGFDMKRVAIVDRDDDTEERAVGLGGAGDRVRRWGTVGAIWSGLFGVAFVPTLMVIPRIGLILSVAILASFVLAAVLVHIGIPKDSVIRDQTPVRASKFLLMANGHDAQIDEARAILARGASKPAVQAR